MTFNNGVLLWLLLPSPVAAQRVEMARVRKLAGCWATTVGKFSSVRATPITDIDLTNVPPRVRLDTIPGRGWHDEPRGWRLRAIPGAGGSRYRDGYFATASVPLAAQSRLISQQALIAVVENHKAAVLRYVDAAPDSMLGFRPTKGVRTFAEQIEHAAGSDALIAHLAITGSENVPAMGDSAVYLHNKAALRKYAAAAMDHTIQMLKGVSDAAMSQTIVQFGHKVTRGRALMELLDHFP